MGVRTEDSVTLCQRALQIVTELCLAGHVDREKCADIFPLESNIPGKRNAGKYEEKQRFSLNIRLKDYPEFIEMFAYEASSLSCSLADRLCIEY